MFWRSRLPSAGPEGCSAFGVGAFSSLLQRPGSLWFESAFVESGGALCFSNPVATVELTSPDALPEFFLELESRLDEGYFLAGWLGYEAGKGFERNLFVAPSASRPPGLFGWFGVYREPQRFSREEVRELFLPLSSQAAAFPSVLSFSCSEEDYAGKIAAIRRQIAAGNVYQVNFTGRYRFGAPANPVALFATLRQRQPDSWTAMLNTPDRQILTLSPELFFRCRGRHIETMPMKGTAPRGASEAEDCHRLQELQKCTKNRAENLMIVDLLRNDLGRICLPGSVRVPELFAPRSWPTLHQMVSRIKGELRGDVDLYELFRALFPCGSVTGAPKIRAMQLIAELEDSPRGVYTGTVGYMTPGREMVFNVAIRTLEVRGNEAVYGSGSGIVWDSNAREEFRECALKADILRPSSGMGAVGLFESMLWNGEYLFLPAHLQRMESSAVALGLPFNPHEALELLSVLEREMLLSGARFKVRLTLSPAGELAATHESIVSSSKSAALRICLAADRVDSRNPLLQHKTTARELYDRYYREALRQGYDEVLFANERGEVAEGAISSVFVERGRFFLTPPSGAGILRGVMRGYLLKTRPGAMEAMLLLKDLNPGERLFLANAVRGLRPAIFTGETVSAQ
ncbi:aminodeoxychorismate synthase component I [Chlorobium phaeovibrioides]|uniref:Aminodeoxychorismate synthase component I n=1 Tax=Chlorobium phaeovibrioides TaxID=1094 RepID=A0A5M8IF79_CHLPH|nr:aminodeoxychorismate synthase component I [Chlorobium phaeovibrioides]KAA6233085.1 aminodeoxychorismate synthase component I [Chlorobium phaeovibrioides]